MCAVDLTLATLLIEDPVERSMVSPKKDVPFWIFAQQKLRSLFPFFFFLYHGTMTMNASSIYPSCFPFCIVHPICHLNHLIGLRALVSLGVEHFRKNQWGFLETFLVREQRVLQK